MLRVAGVVVTFDRPDMLKACLERVAAQTTRPDKVFVIDNSPSDDTKEMLERYFPHVEYRHFPENIGSEGGYSEGIALASVDSDYIWLLDDDCVSENTALEELIRWALMLSKKIRLGAVRSARQWDHGKGEPIMEIGDLFAWKGTMISSAAVMTLGLPVKDLFLYAGDIEYGLRMKKAGYGIYMVFPSRIDSLHFSEKTTKMFGTKAESYDQPFRVYYSYRNELWVRMKYRSSGMVCKLILHGMRNILFLTLIGRFAQAGAVFSGIIDGFAARLGKNPRYLP